MGAAAVIGTQGRRSGRGQAFIVSSSATRREAQVCTGGSAALQREHASLPSCTCAEKQEPVEGSSCKFFGVSGGVCPLKPSEEGFILLLE